MLEKCATPAIAYANGELTFSCETEGVEYVYDVRSSGASGSCAEGKIQLTPTLTVSVYVTKKDHENSETATKEIDLIGVKGDVSGDGHIDMGDVTKIIDYILGRE